MREVNLLLQDPRALTCGQCCVAMATGETLSTVIAATGTGGRTSAKVLRRVLDQFGIRTSHTRKITGAAPLPLYAIAHQNSRTPDGKVEFPNRGHWVLIWNGKIFDPLPVDYHWINFNPDTCLISCFELHP
jgi:hypothetical protein